MNIQICHGQNCADYGGIQLATSLAERGMRFERISCRSLCPHAPVVLVDGRLKLRITAAELEQLDVE